MFSKMSERGFAFVMHEAFESQQPTRLISESSHIGDYPDSAARPGSSGLWVGNDHRLDRQQVQELVDRMQHWLATGRLAVDTSAKISKHESKNMNTEKSPESLPAITVVMPVLESCPFCGAGDDTLYVTKKKDRVATHYYVVCDECNTEGPSFSSEDSKHSECVMRNSIEAAILWNRRV